MQWCLGVLLHFGYSNSHDNIFSGKCEAILLRTVDKSDSPTYIDCSKARCFNKDLQNGARVSIKQMTGGNKMLKKKDVSLCCFITCHCYFTLTKVMEIIVFCNIVCTIFMIMMHIFNRLVSSLLLLEIYFLSFRNRSTILECPKFVTPITYNFHQHCTQGHYYINNSIFIATFLKTHHGEGRKNW